MPERDAGHTSLGAYESGKTVPWFDLRGNHDTFNVPSRTSELNLYQRHGVSANLGKAGQTQEVVRGRKGSFQIERGGPDAEHYAVDYIAR